MALAPGTRLGPYEVIAPLGAGGMGEVYRARDTRPQVAREVAIKLVSGVAPDAATLARFEREARSTAALAHPNVVALFDVGVHEGTPYLVEELLTGETLRARMRSGPVAPRKAVEWLRQVTLGLAAAHARDLVHRDVKPENIFLTSDGHVKLLDFGLAKAATGPTAGATTVAQAATTAGDAVTSGHVVLGTVGYMSPEQVRGQGLDHRSDIFSVGVVLYELLTGRRPFDRVTAADTMSAILAADPASLSPSGAPVPAALERLLARCLEKAPADRFQSTRDLAFALETAAGNTERQTPTADPLPRRVAARLAMSLAAGLAIGVVAFSAGRVSVPSVQPEGSPMQRVSLLIDPATGLSEGATLALAISPSGDAVAYVGQHEGTPTLFVRVLTDAASRRVPNATGANAPFFSHDGRWVAFGASGGLRRAPVAGGEAELLCASETTVYYGGFWGADDRIVFATVLGLMEVSAKGGDCRLIASPDRTARESLFSQPQILATGEILMTTMSVSDDVDAASIEVLTADRTSRRRILQGARNARLLPSGHLVFVRGSSIIATRFDLPQLTPSPNEVTMVEGVALDALGHPTFDVSNTGTLVFWTANDVRGKRTLVWSDRRGQRVDTGAPLRSYQPEPLLSPDGERVAVSAGDANHFLWLFSFRQKTLEPLWLDRDSHSPVWSPDGRRIAFQAGTDGTRVGSRIAIKDVDRVGDPVLVDAVSGPGRVTPSSWAPDGRSLAYVIQAPETGLDVGVLDVATNTSKALLNSKAQETRPQYSPDGRWLAYQSNESGRFEIYVTDASASTLKRQVSTSGGTDPVWARAGRELFFVTGQSMMAAELASGPQLAFRTPVRLFDGVESGATFTGYSVAPDGRFLLRSSPPRHDGPSNHVTLVLNWHEELRRLVPLP